MFDLLIAFMTLVLIVLCVLVANLYLSVQKMRRELHALTHGAQAATRGVQDAAHGTQGATQASSQAAAQRASRPVQTTSVAMPRPIHKQPKAPVPPRMTQAPLQPGPDRAQRPSYQEPPRSGHTHDSKSERNSIENVLGTRVLGILAALLVFAGLVFLAILMVPMLSDEVRCAAMFVISGALATAGAFVTERKKTPFSLALLGCGLGSVFVSLIVAYVYFGFLGDVLALALMLAWLGACTLLAKRHKSVALAVVEQLGMAISVCFAYLQGIDQGQLPLVVAYQLMACIIVVVGCLTSLERGRLAGVFASMAISLLASYLVASAYAFSPTRFDAVSFTGTMGTQLIVMSVFLLLICVLQGQDDNEKGARSRATTMTSHIFAELLWFVALVLDVCVTALLAWDKPAQIDAIQLASFAAVACVCVHWAATVFLQRAKVLSGAAAYVSIDFCAVVSVLLLAWRVVGYERAVIPFVLVVAIALWLTGLTVGDLRHQEHAVAFVAADALLMLAHGYRALNDAFGMPVAILYLALLDVVVFLWWRTLPEQKRMKALSTAFAIAVLATEVSLGSAWDGQGLVRGLSDLYAICCALLLVGFLAFFEPKRRLGLTGQVDTLLHVNEFVVLGLSCILVVAKGPQHYMSISAVAPAISIGASFAAGGIVAYRLLGIAQHPSESPSWEQVGTGVLLTLWSTCFAQGFVSAGMQTLVTVVAMLAALACIVVGLARRLAALRLYGLITALLCVLKIVTVDIHGADPLGRVIAFILGGIICFVISAAYTFAVHRMERPGTTRGH